MVGGGQGLFSLKCVKIYLFYLFIFYRRLFAGLGGSDAHPTGDQEVVGSTPAGSATFFCGDLIMKYFLRSFSPFR